MGEEVGCSLLIKLGNRVYPVLDIVSTRLSTNSALSRNVKNRFKTSGRSCYSFDPFIFKLATRVDLGFLLCDARK